MLLSKNLLLARYPVIWNLFGYEKVRRFGSFPTDVEAGVFGLFVDV